MSITIAFPLGYKPVLKHGDHDQSDHGSWATGQGDFDDVKPVPGTHARRRSEEQPPDSVFGELR